LGDGERFGPWGWDGGRDARPNVFTATTAEGDSINVGMYRTNMPVSAGTMLDCFQPGGGGFGDPFTRDVGFVIQDLQEGLISREVAERDYGVRVVLYPDGRLEVDLEETQRIRSFERAVNA
jgi:N-methylhydantoinase B